MDVSTDFTKQKLSLLPNCLWFFIFWCFCLPIFWILYNDISHSYIEKFEPIDYYCLIIKLWWESIQWPEKLTKQTKHNVVIISRLRLKLILSYNKFFFFFFWLCIHIFHNMKKTFSENFQQIQLKNRLPIWLNPRQRKKRREYQHLSGNYGIFPVTNVGLRWKKSSFLLWSAKRIKKGLSNRFKWVTERLTAPTFAVSNRICSRLMLCFLCV